MGIFLVEMEMNIVTRSRGHSSHNQKFGIGVQSTSVPTPDAQDQIRTRSMESLAQRTTDAIHILSTVETRMSVVLNPPRYSSLHVSGGYTCLESVT
jgi:hypothetical protein